MTKPYTGVDLLTLLQGGRQATGLYIVSADTANSLVFEGSSKPLDLDLFEIPKNLKPIVPGKRYFALPIISESISQRWGIIQILN